MEKTVKNFYIFRHGESTYNVKGLVQGHSNDSVLTPNGEQQARKAAERLKDKDIDIIISSPLIRAKQTAKIVAEVIKVPVICDDYFTEVNVGVIEGLHYEDVEKTYGELYQKWRSCALDDMETKFENGETKIQVRQRVFAGLTYYAKRCKFFNVAISGHGIIIMQALLALGIENRDIPNGSIIHLIYQGSTWNFNGFLE